MANTEELEELSLRLSSIQNDISDILDTLPVLKTVPQSIRNLVWNSFTALECAVTECQIFQEYQEKGISYETK
jgi:hypothetical protein